MDKDVFAFPISSLNKVVRYGFPMATPSLPTAVRSQLGRAGFVFILFIIHVANQRREHVGSKQISLNDIFWALNYTGFHEFIPELKVYLDYLRIKKSNDRKRAARSHSNKDNVDDNDENNDNNDDDEVIGGNIDEPDDGEDFEGEVGHINKRQRR